MNLFNTSNHYFFLRDVIYTFKAELGLFHTSHFNRVECNSKNR